MAEPLEGRVAIIYGGGGGIEGGTMVHVTAGLVLR
jgi:hypothetical protein